MENFNEQEVSTELSELTNEDSKKVEFPKTSDVIDELHAKELIKKFSDKFHINIPDGPQYEAALKVLKGRDLSKYNSTTGRAKICWSLLSCVEVDYDIVPKDIQDTLDAGGRLVPCSGLYSDKGINPDSSTLKCNRGQFKTYGDKAKNYINSKMKMVYEELFGKGSYENTVEIRTISTGDGSSTAGVKGEKNVGRLFRSYRDSVDGDEKLDTSKNYIKFGENEELPMIINISAYGHDSTGGEATIVLESRDTEEDGDSEQKDSKSPEIYKIKYDYSTGTLKVNCDKLPEGVKVEGGRITLQPTIKNKYFVRIETSSNKIKENNTYDEVNFDVAIENGGFGGGERIDSSFKGGHYEINDEDKEDINQKMTEIMNDIDKGNKKYISMYVVSDNTAFKNTDRNLIYKNMKSNSDKLKQEIEMQFSNKEIVRSIIDDFQKSFDKNSKNVQWKHENGHVENSSEEIKFQWELALNRFLGVFLEMIKNKSFKEKLEKGEIPFDTNFRVGDDERFVAIKAKAISG